MIVQVEKLFDGPFLLNTDYLVCASVHKDSSGRVNGCLLHMNQSVTNAFDRDIVIVETVEDFSKIAEVKP